MNIVRHSIFLFVFLIFLSVVFPVIASAQGDPKLEMPETLDEAKEGVLNIGDKVFGAIPEVIAGLWRNEIIPVWKAMGKWAKEEVLEKRLTSARETLLDKLKELLGKEVEKRKPLIEEEIKQQGEKAGKGLWERFESLFQEGG